MAKSQQERCKALGFGAKRLYPAYTVLQTQQAFRVNFVQFDFDVHIIALGKGL